MQESEKKSGGAGPAGILFLNHVSRMGGAERALLHIVKFLDRAKFAPFVVLPGPGPLAHKLLRQRVSLEYMPLRRFKRTANPAALAGCLFNVLSVSMRLAGFIRRNDIRVLHANSNSAQIYAGLASAFAGIPCVWHCRDLVDLGVPGRVMCALASRIVAVSESVAAHLLLSLRLGSKRGASRMTVIRNGIDPDELRPTASRGLVRRGLGLSDDSIVVVMAGQMVPWKNHALFLQAASIIAGEFGWARFLVVGEDMFGDHPDYRKQLDAMVATLGLSGSVVFAGYRSDIADVLAASDLLIHPADREPFGRIILEAMCVGLPVLAVNSCGPAEIIRDGTDGILVEPGNAGAMARAAADLIRNPDTARRIAESARNRVARDFHCGAVARRVELLYSDLIAQ